MRLDKPINQIDSIVGIPIFSTKNEKEEIPTIDFTQECGPSNETMQEKRKRENTVLKQLKLGMRGDKTWHIM